jgi:hypothetical protein
VFIIPKSKTMVSSGWETVLGHSGMITDTSQPVPLSEGPCTVLFDKPTGLLSLSTGSTFTAVP